MDVKLYQDVLDMSAQGTRRQAKLLRNVIGLHSPHQKVRTSRSRLVKVANGTSLFAALPCAEFSSASTRVRSRGGIQVSPRSTLWTTDTSCLTDSSFGTHPKTPARTVSTSTASSSTAVTATIGRPGFSAMV